MSASYRILPRQGIVYVRYEGTIILDEVEEIFAQYRHDPEAHPGQKQLVDLSRVTALEPDFAKLMRMQADKAGVLPSPVSPMIMVLYAPTEIALEIGRILVAPWKDVPGMIASLQVDEVGVLSILGETTESLATLLDGVS